MKEDKKTTEQFFTSKGIDAQHFPKKSDGKSVDLELYVDDKLWGYCEIKSIVAYNFIGERSDPTYNKIQNKIHEASKQFIACNPNHEYPNILVFINHSERIGFPDLWLVLTGEYLPPTYHSEPIELRYLKRLDKTDDLSQIDYFVWIDHGANKIFYSINSNSSFIEFLKTKICSKAYENIPNYAFLT